MSSPPAPSVTVIIPALAAAGNVAEAVQSALSQPEVTEVVVAAADEGTRRAALAVDDGRLRVVDNPDGSTPAALNRALAASSGEVVVRCDAHARLPRGYVARALETLERTGAVNVGGRQVPVGTTPFQRAVAAAMISPLGAGDARYRIGGKPGPVDTVYLGVFRRQALDAVGGYDETLDRNQDYELNWRLRQAGGIVWFDPELAVEYRPRGGLESLGRQYFQYGLWKRMVLRRHPGSLQARQLAAPVLVAGLAASVVAAPFSVPAALALPALYGTVTVAAGLFDASRHRDPALLLVPLALWTMHVAWGCGFINGLLTGRRRGPRLLARRSWP